MNDEEKKPAKAHDVNGVEAEPTPMGRFKFSDSDELQKDSEFGFGSVDDLEPQAEPQK